MTASLASAAGPGGESTPFSEEWLQDRAQRLAGSEYVPPTSNLPPSVASLSYDQYRDIRFRPEASVWRGGKSLFHLQLFHAGYIFREPVMIHVVEGGRSRRVDYTTSLFDYGANRFAEPLPETLGFAGFRVHHPLNSADYFDEVIAFLGASYFRAVGRGNVYGLSTRGLAIDTAVDTGEIFPSFREFYIEAPAAGSRRLVIHALLDSPTATGAYRFDVTPGESTEVKVEATLYPRRGAERLGLAPLTSMFLFGENGRRGFDDYRSEVHDSDGLLLWLGNGERLWRPLTNPAGLEVSAFRADSPKAFGLLQRDRNPRSYEDTEAEYERRPSAWIEPIHGFGRGQVFLVEIPSREEINDNVVAFFTPDEKLTPGTPVRFGYRLLWGSAPEPPIGTATTVATRIGSARQVGVPAAQQPLPASARKIVVDFAVPAPAAGSERAQAREPRRTRRAPPAAPLSAENVEVVVSVSSGVVHNPTVHVYRAIHGYRAFFDFVPTRHEPVEMRCFLRRDGAALTETWTYRLPAPAPPAEDSPTSAPPPAARSP